jgi:hypothetical protein
MEQNGFVSLLYRYFFFSWLFHDADCGNRLERIAAWHHNRAQAHWLLTYLKRWLVLGLLLLAGAGVCTLLAPVHWISVPFYVMFSVAVPISSVIAVAWLGFRFLPAP